MNIGLSKILLNTQMRERNFQEQNNISTKDIAAKYPAMTGTTKNPGPTLEASCLGMYPGSAFNFDKSDQLNYINFVNEKHKSVANRPINKSDQIKQLNMPAASANYSYNTETFKNVGAAISQPAAAPRVMPGDRYTGNTRSGSSGYSGYSGYGSGSGSGSGYGNTLQQQQGRHFIADPNRTVVDPSLDRNFDITGKFDSGNLDQYTRTNIFAQPMQGSLYNINSIAEQPLQRPEGIYSGPAAGGFVQPGPQYPPGTVVDLDQFIESNDTTSAYLTNLNGRPIVDFSSNNMVPFATKFTQNMAGTGVRSAYDVDGSTFDSGADNSTPNQTKLATFTGLDDTYMHKREAGPFYSPAEQQMGYVYGSPLFREDVDQYTQSLRTKNELTPVQAIQVGPGLDLDPSIPANGGFHDFTRVMPNNISDYKANQLEGRVNAGKYVTGAELPSSYPGVGGAMNSGGQGVVKHRPTSYWTQARIPTMTTKVANNVDATMLRSEYQADFKPKNPLREQTSYGFGSATPGKGSKNVAPVPRSYGELQGSW